MKKIDFAVGWLDDDEMLFINTLEKESKVRDMNFMVINKNNVRIMTLYLSGSFNGLINFHYNSFPKTVNKP